MSKYFEFVIVEGVEVWYDICDCILDVGVELIFGCGFLVVGLVEIFGCVQVFKGLFYYYFGLKEDFGVVMLECYFQDYDVGVVSLFNDMCIIVCEWLLCYFMVWIDLYECSVCEVICLVVKLLGEVLDLLELMCKVLLMGMMCMVECIVMVIEVGVIDGLLVFVEDVCQLVEGLYVMWMGGVLLVKVYCNVVVFKSCVM